MCLSLGTQKEKSRQRQAPSFLLELLFHSVICGMAKLKVF